MGLANGIPVTFISVGSNNSDDLGGFLDLTNYLLSQSSPPQVLTTSYAYDEQDFDNDESVAEYALTHLFMHCF